MRFVFDNLYFVAIGCLLFTFVCFVACWIGRNERNLTVWLSGLVFFLLTGAGWLRISLVHAARQRAIDVHDLDGNGMLNGLEATPAAMAALHAASADTGLSFGTIITLLLALVIAFIVGIVYYFLNQRQSKKQLLTLEHFINNDPN